MLVHFDDLEPNFFLYSDGEEATSLGEFCDLRNGCNVHGSMLVTVVDAECQVVCFAPLDIARKIVELLNKENQNGSSS